MDPNVTLKEIREIVHAIARAESATAIGALANSLALRVEALDVWIKGGGFPPDEWRPTGRERVWGTHRDGELTLAALRRAKMALRRQRS